MTVEEIKDCWIAMSIEKYRTEVGLKPGALEFLKYCRERGIRTGVATSNGRDMVDAVIESLKIGDYLGEVATACEVAAGKPEPDIYLEVARRLAVEPEECLVFEDIPAGIRGRKAGRYDGAAPWRMTFQRIWRQRNETLADGYHPAFAASSELITSEDLLMITRTFLPVCRR